MRAHHLDNEFEICVDEKDVYELGKACNFPWKQSCLEVGHGNFYMPFPYFNYRRYPQHHKAAMKQTDAERFLCAMMK